MAEPRPRRPRVIVTRRLTPAIEARMAELFDARFNREDKPFDRDQLGHDAVDVQSAADAWR